MENSKKIPAGSRVLSLFLLAAFVFCAACAHTNAEPEVKVKGQYDISVGGTW